jgi:hypothetical protein
MGSHVVRRALVKHFGTIRAENLKRPSRGLEVSAIAQKPGPFDALDGAAPPRGWFTCLGAGASMSRRRHCQHPS